MGDNNGIFLDQQRLDLSLQLSDSGRINHSLSGHLVEISLYQLTLTMIFDYLNVALWVYHFKNA
jgi:hypothetical protein